METPEESDQLPEEDAARPDARESPGVPGEGETSTGNPDAAGSEE
jgi:hypothetical protein